MFFGKSFYFALLDQSVEVNEKALQEKYKGKVRVLNSLKKEKGLRVIVVTQEGINAESLRQDFSPLEFTML